MARAEDSSDSAGEASGRKGLGTFAGVFTPSILTILGIILFLRLGFVVGSAGLGQALVVIVLANVISVLTSLSLAAIATNFEVRGGGDYYLISRTLGPQFGGAIGIVLFLAQSVSVAFYAIGFAEGATALFGVEWLSERMLAGAALLPLFLLSWLGSDWATRFQFAIMAVLVLALGSFFVGAAGSFDAALLGQNWSPAGTLGFWGLFALFFPAVTGFTQGVSMSGELRDPARSLPAGTFAAVGLSMLVYLAAAVLFAGALPATELSGSYDAMARVAAVPALITAGIFAATLSSALASFLGAPRILQALAGDRLFGILNPFAKGEGATENPRRAVLLCFAIAGATVAVGDLNVVAPVVSMFFLISYGLLNYATYYEARSASPAFRPRFRWFRPQLSLLGCLACVGTMVAIDPTAGAAALGVMVMIHQFLRRTAGSPRWADASRSALFQRVRSSLHEMHDATQHDRYWRPVTLAFSDDPGRRERLIRFASWIDGGSGITTAVRVLETSGARARAERLAAAEELAADVRERQLEAFTRVVAMADLETGFPVLLQSAGLGPIRPSIALFNWFDREESAEGAPALRSFGAYLRMALRNDCDVVLLAARTEAFQRLMAQTDEERVIDVYWRGDASSRLALLLAYLMTRRAPWDEARLRLLARRSGERSEEDELAELEAELEAVRIRAEPELVPDTDWTTVAERSARSSLAFVTFRVRPEGLCDAEGAPLGGSLEGLPPLALVVAERKIDLEAQPDEGVAADQARKEDALGDALARTASLEKQAKALRTAAESARTRLAGLREGQAAADELQEAQDELARAEADLAEVERRAAKLGVKRQALEREADPSGAGADGS